MLVPEPAYIKRLKLQGINRRIKQQTQDRNVKNALNKGNVDINDVSDAMCFVSLAAWGGACATSKVGTGSLLKLSTSITNTTLPFCNFFYFLNDTKNWYQVSQHLDYLERSHKKLKIPYMSDVVSKKMAANLTVNNNIFEGTINALGTNKTNFKLLAGNDALNVIGSIFVLTGLFSNPITLWIGIGLGIVTTTLYIDRFYKSYSHDQEKNNILLDLTHPDERLALCKKDFKLQYKKFARTIVNSKDYRKYGGRLVKLIFHMTGSKNTSQDVNTISVEKFYRTQEKKALTFSSKFALDALVFNYESRNEQKRTMASQLIILFIGNDKKRSILLAKFANLSTHDERFEFLKTYLKINRDFRHNHSNKSRFRKAILKNKNMSLIL